MISITVAIRTMARCVHAPRAPLLLPPGTHLTLARTLTLTLTLAPNPNPNSNPNPNQERVGACCDCTHLCYTPLFWDAVFGGLARTVRTAQRGDNQRTIRIAQRGDNLRTGIPRTVRIAQRGDNQRLNHGTLPAAIARLPPLGT